MEIKSIGIFGAGYVGGSLGLVLSKHHKVMLYDIDRTKIDAINKHDFSWISSSIRNFDYKKDNLHAIKIPNEIQNHDLFIIATPTNYDDKTNNFDTSIVNNVIMEICNSQQHNPLILIKSTVSVGYTQNAKEQFKNPNIIFSPEFLREASAIEDNLNPSRIIVGEDSVNGRKIARIFQNISQNNPKLIFMSSSEAEAVKLFSNTYLAMRVAFFNELDTYSMMKDFDVEKIIEGISSDMRIGNYYNNPSFGYGGYCLPKDSKQLLANYRDIPQNLIQAIVDSNETRKKFIADQILSQNKARIGVYKLDMKQGSSNSRSAAIIDIIKDLIIAKKNILIFSDEKSVNIFEDSSNVTFTNNIELFTKNVDLIIANRIDEQYEIMDKKIIFTRDIFHEN